MKKQLTGIVKSDKMTRTAAVTVTSVKTHPLYLKKTKWTKSYLADNQVKAKIGDTVVMESVRPIRKKRYLLPRHREDVFPTWRSSQMDCFGAKPLAMTGWTRKKV